VRGKAAVSASQAGWPALGPGPLYVQPVDPILSLLQWHPKQMVIDAEAQAVV
jgi:hypothetical protein